MAVTSTDAIKQMAAKEVTLSGFDAGEEITVRVKSLSLLGLVQSGKLPNQLLGTAVELFEGKKANKDVPANKMNDKLNDMAGLIDIICANALVEPKWEEIGDLLNDKQKMEIFYFTQGGLSALDSFRSKQTAK